MFLIALITVIGFVIYLNKIGAKNLRRLMAFELYVDLAVDALLIMMFSYSGTFAGAAVGAIAGLMFNVMLFFMKRMAGWDELRTIQCNACKHSHREWITHAGVGWWFLLPPPLRRRLRPGLDKPAPGTAQSV